MNYERAWKHLKKHIEGQKEDTTEYYSDGILIDKKLSYDNDKMSIRETLYKMDEIEDLLEEDKLNEFNNDI